MSIALSVFVPKASQSWTSRDLQRTITSAGFTLELDTFDPRRQLGMTFCRYQGTRTGFEYSLDALQTYMRAVRELKKHEPNDFPYSEADLVLIRRHHHVVQLVTHSSSRARVAAVIVGACLAHLTGGVALNEPVWAWNSPDSAIPWARAMESEMQSDIASEGA